MKKILFLILLLISSVSYASDEEIVKLNTKTYIYHSIDCKWAKRCTKNCISSTKEKAKSRGARACKVCGG